MRYDAATSSDKPAIRIRITSQLRNAVFTTRIKARRHFYRDNGLAHECWSYWPLDISVGEPTAAALIDFAQRYEVISVSPDDPENAPTDMAIELEPRPPNMNFSQYPARICLDLPFNVYFFDSSHTRIGESRITGTGETDPADTRSFPYARMAYGCSPSAPDTKFYRMMNSAVDAAIHDALNQIFSRLCIVEWAQATLTSDVNRLSVNDVTLAGVRQFENQNYRKARLYFQRALLLNPSFQPAVAYLGACYTLMGERTLAAKTLQVAINLDPQTAQAQQAAKWLAKFDLPPPSS